MTRLGAASTSRAPAAPRPVAALESKAGESDYLLSRSLNRPAPNPAESSRQARFVPLNSAVETCERLSGHLVGLFRCSARSTPIFQLGSFDHSPRSNLDLRVDHTGRFAVKIDPAPKRPERAVGGRVKQAHGWRGRLSESDPERCQMIESASQAQDRAAKARSTLQRSFVDRAGGDEVEAERLKHEFYARIGRRSGAVRRAKAAAREAAELAELAELGIQIMSEAELAAKLRDGSL
jgi:hypothetical protein